jgi:hypothetical protein
MPNHSMPSGLSAGLPMCAHEELQVPGMPLLAE